MDRAAALEAVAESIRRHRGCGQEPCAQATNLVPGEGAADAAVVIVGEAPGAAEDTLGRPFVGASGRLLDQLLEAAGLDRSAVFITNVVKARPPGNRDPRRDEIAHHLPWLVAQLEIIAPRFVVTLGRHALGHFAPGLRISDVHGTVVEQGGRTLFPLYHPAAAMHRPPLRETLYADARALGAALR